MFLDDTNLVELHWNQNDLGVVNPIWHYEWHPSNFVQN